MSLEWSWAGRMIIWQMLWNWETELSNPQDTIALTVSHLVRDASVEVGDEVVDDVGDCVLRKRKSFT
jgi:hypothetical protein